MTPKFFGRVARGKFTLWNKESLETYLSQQPDGDYELVIRPKSQIRSEQLNRYLHGVVIETISDHTGYTKEEAKDLMKQDFGVRNGDGSLKSTAKYTNTEMIDFISKMIHFWAENDVIIPDPNSVDMEEK
jgi:hypothetical protein